MAKKSDSREDARRLMNCAATIWDFMNDASEQVMIEHDQYDHIQVVGKNGHERHIGQKKTGFQLK